MKRKPILINGIIILFLMTAFFSCKKKGCTDPFAINYSEKAKKEDPDEPCQYASRDAENKNIVLQEITNLSCGSCPGGHKLAQEIHDLYPNDVIIMAVHYGNSTLSSNYNIDLRTEFSSGFLSGANGGGSFGTPLGIVNRKDFVSLGYSQTGGLGMSKQNWGAAAGIILAEPSYVNVGASSSIDATTRVLTVNVEAYFTSNGISDNRINVAILQNNIQSSQAGGSYGNPDAWSNVTNLYSHAHVVRHLVTGQWGEVISSTSEGTVFEKTFTYTVPASLDSDPNDSYSGYDYDLDNLEVVVYVSEGQNEIVTGAVSSWK
jgi:hypothetical protein